MYYGVVFGAITPDFVVKKQKPKRENKFYSETITQRD